MSEQRIAIGTDLLDITRPVARRAKSTAMGCAHGASSALVLGGTTSVSDLTLLDILLARHHAANECRCTPDPRLVPTSAARA